MDEFHILSKKGSEYDLCKKLMTKKKIFGRAGIHALIQQSNSVVQKNRQSQGNYFLFSHLYKITWKQKQKYLGELAITSTKLYLYEMPVFDVNSFNKMST